MALSGETVPARREVLARTPCALPAKRCHGLAEVQRASTPASTPAAALDCIEYSPWFYARAQILRRRVAGTCPASAAAGCDRGSTCNASAARCIAATQCQRGSSTCRARRDEADPQRRARRSTCLAQHGVCGHDSAMLCSDRLLYYAMHCHAML